MPLPMCATTSRRSVYFSPARGHTLGHGLGIQHVPAAMAFDQRLPEMRALSGHSSTLTGSTTKASAPASRGDLLGQKRTQV